MAIQVKRMKLPYEKRGKVFTVSLPVYSHIVRAGISPTDGEPSIWYTVRFTQNNDVVESKFVIITDDETIDDAEAVHRGIWWEGNYTFHLFELNT